MDLEDVREGLLFARRIYFPRVLGTMLCGFIIAVTAYEKMSLVECVFLALNSLVWGTSLFGYRAILVIHSKWRRLTF